MEQKKGIEKKKRQKGEKSINKTNKQTNKKD
jgi:hypothetical protein